MAQECSGAGDALTRVFALLGKRWTGLILAVLMHDQGEARFAELRRAIPGISERMLSDRLTELAAAGLIVREVVPGPPLGVNYRLTTAGRALGPAMEALGVWAETHLLATGLAAGPGGC